jgi:hypothetical protein
MPTWGERGERTPHLPPQKTLKFGHKNATKHESELRNFIETNF